ncbi:MAG: hypothetical protein OXH38_03175 [Chloroflexi bacterium]|nr:hypothetical protein [Chloroflexota bacterium]
MNDEAATEFVTELNTQTEEALTPRDQTALGQPQLLQAMAELEARLTRHINQTAGILLAGYALGVGLIVAFA